MTGAAASYILDVPLLVGLLLGSIAASTDAAAVFSVLRSQGLQLRQRLAATLEIESGSNDPMAIFLTVGLVEVLAGRMTLGADLVVLFLTQMGLGALAGLASGWVAARLTNRVNLGAAGLYPLLAGACGLIAFGVAAVLGGSGFLAIYLAGIVLGNSRLVFQRGTFLFMDGLAWMGQIAMFVVLGLLSTPSELTAIAGPALLVSAVVILVARPLAVLPLLWPFRFTRREQLLISSTSSSSSCWCRPRCRDGRCPCWRRLSTCRKRGRRSPTSRWNSWPCATCTRTWSNTGWTAGLHCGERPCRTCACRTAR